MCILQVITGYSVAPLYVISGLFWPIESMPLYFQWVVKWSPMTAPIIALRSVMYRGWTPYWFDVLFGYLISLLYIIVFTIINVILSIKT